MKLKPWMSFGPSVQRAGPSPGADTVEDRISTLGWVCMALVVVAGLLAWSYVSI
jgi:hypothetical protein